MKTKNEQIAWLAGLWDGEGTITLTKVMDNWYVKKAMRKNGSIKYKPICTVVNTNETIISEAIRILDENDIKLSISKARKEKEYHTQCLVIQTQKLSVIKRLLELLLPYLIGKKSQAELLLRYVNSRIENFKGKKGLKSYNGEEDKFEKDIRTLNKRGSKPSETIRLTPKGDDIVRTNGKPLEVNSKS